ncbi:MAG: hypothetical protein AB8B55_11925 [Mariniblastus sp.]
MRAASLFCFVTLIGIFFGGGLLVGQDSIERTEDTFFVEGAKALTGYDSDFRYGAAVEPTSGGSIVRIYDLTSGKIVKKFSLPFVFQRVLAVAPDASSVCVQTSGKFETWSSGEKPERLASVKTGNSGRLGGTTLAGANAVLDGPWPFAAYVAPDRLLTMEKSTSKLQLHSLGAGGELLYESAELKLDNCPPRISSDKKTFYYSSDPKAGKFGGANFTQVNFLDVNTGKLIRKLDLVPDENCSVFGQLLSRDGTKIVSRLDEVVGATTTSYLTVWDAETGGMMAKIPYRGKRSGKSWTTYQWIDEELVAEVEASTKDTFNVNAQTFVARWQFVSPDKAISESAEIESQRATKVPVFSSPKYIPNSNELLYHYKVAGGYAVEIKRGIKGEDIARIKDMTRPNPLLFLRDGQTVELSKVDVQGNDAPVNFETDLKAELSNAMAAGNKPLRPGSSQKISVKVTDLQNGMFQGRFTLKTKTGTWFHDHFVNSNSWEGIIEATKNLKLKLDYLQFPVEEIKIDTAMNKPWYDAHELKMADVVAAAAANKPMPGAFSGVNKAALVLMPSEYKNAYKWNVRVYDQFIALDDRLVKKPMRLFQTKDSVSVTGAKFATFVTLANQKTDKSVRQIILLYSDPTGRTFASRFDLKTKKKLSTTPVPAGTILLDILPTATQWLTTDKDRKKLQIWNSDAKDPEGADSKSDIEIDLKGAKFANAYLTTAKQVVTLQGGEVVVRRGTSRLNASGTREMTQTYEEVIGTEVICYDVKTGKQLYFRKSNLGKLKPTPARRYFVGVDGSDVLFLNSADGQLAGKIDAASGDLGGFSPDARIAISDVDFRFDGKELAVTHGGTFQTGIWDLKTGKFKWLLTTGMKIGNWSGDFNVYRNLIYHTPTSNSVCSVVPAEGMTRIGDKANDLWFLVTVGKYLCLSRHSVPGKDLKNFFPKYVKKVDLKRKRVAIKIEAPGDKEAFAEKLRKVVAKRLVAEGFEVIETGVKVDDPIFTARVVFQAEPRDSDFTRPQLGFEEGEKSLLCADRFITGELFVTVDKGGTIPLCRLSRKLSKIDYKIDWSAKDPKSDLLRQFEDDFIARVSSVTWPKEWLTETEGTPNGPKHMLGESKFDEGELEFGLSGHAKKVLKKK